MPTPSFYARIAWFVIAVCYTFSGLHAQTTHLFTDGLYVQVPANYGREAIYTDVLLWHYYQGTTRPPQSGQALFEWDGEESPIWAPITADTSGFFRPQPDAGGNLNSPNNPAGPGRIDRPSSTTQPAQPRRGWGPSYLYLTYQSPKTQVALLNIRGNSAVLVNGQLHTGDPYRMGWMHIPVQLKKGVNEFFVRGLFVAAALQFPQKPVYLNTDDLTLPDIVQGKDNSRLLAGVVVINTSSKTLRGLTISSTIQGQVAETALPDIAPYGTRKVAIPINATRVTTTGDISSQIKLSQKGKMIDQQELLLRSVTPDVPYRITFISEIDGSLQYYAVNPATGGEKPGNALFFSVHGAGVEAIGQAQAYTAKDWGTLIAPTNRRPRGFNWEDWGRIDALEVLALARKTLQPDTQRIYLTGHSMGGHGTWFLGATYPDKWAAIAPCAGYPTLKGYGSADGLIPEKGRNEMENLLLRSSNQSDVIAYASNYKPLGVYILHGDADRTVPVTYARQMRAILGEFHPDFNYYEYPNGSHWYSNESVDWKPLFDYFRWHRRKADTTVHTIDFKTANPGISASYYWATVYQQQEPLKFSRLILSRDIDQGTITGKTENVQTLQLDISAFPTTQSIRIQLDSLPEVTLEKPAATPFVYLKKRGSYWQVAERPSAEEKGPHRNGTFKEAFNRRMVYVYGTHGSEPENQWAIEKARYDAEAWYYRGNGAFDIIADRDFDATAYADRNIILIGNAKTNSVWNTVLADCPIAVNPGTIRVGKKQYEGDDLGGYFIWRKPGTSTGSIGVITGTGLKGMQAATANQYFAGASGFPDYLFFKLDMLKNGPESVIEAGFYTNQWEVAQ